MALIEIQPVEEIPVPETLQIAQRIKHVLLHFPKLSHSMLQIGLGPAMSVKVWRPVLDEMIVEGEIVVETVHTTTPSGRSQTYTIISLAE
jgi:hypothetical protein